MPIGLDAWPYMITAYYYDPNPKCSRNVIYAIIKYCKRKGEKKKRQRRKWKPNTRYARSFTWRAKPKTKLTKKVNWFVWIPVVVSLSLYQDHLGTLANVPGTQPFEGLQIEQWRTLVEIPLPWFRETQYFIVGLWA